jgi:hypothetical protein
MNGFQSLGARREISFRKSEATAVPTLRSGYPLMARCSRTFTRKRSTVRVHAHPPPKRGKSASARAFNAPIISKALPDSKRAESQCNPACQPLQRSTVDASTKMRDESMLQRDVYQVAMVLKNTVLVLSYPHISLYVCVIRFLQGSIWGVK